MFTLQKDKDNFRSNEAKTLRKKAVVKLQMFPTTVYNGQFLYHKLIKLMEVCDIARKSVFIHEIAHYPKFEENKRKLVQKIVGIYEDLANQTITN
nr:hypothetical protein NZ312_17260 [Clostridioides difficile]